MRDSIAEHLKRQVVVGLSAQYPGQQVSLVDWSAVPTLYRQRVKEAWAGSPDSVTAVLDRKSVEGQPVVRQRAPFTAAKAAREVARYGAEVSWDIGSAREVSALLNVVRREVWAAAAAVEHLTEPEARGEAARLLRGLYEQVVHQAVVAARSSVDEQSDAFDALFGLAVGLIETFYPLRHAVSVSA